MSRIRLTVTHGPPVWKAPVESRSVVDVSGYSHEISADGGYILCDFSVNGDRSVGEDWVFNGLGRDVSVYSPGGLQIWRGFVNEVSLVLGALSVTRGPLLDVVNSAVGKYQTPSYTIANVTIGGKQATTSPPITDTSSQSKYGTREKMLNIGTATATEADQAINTYLIENKEPSMNYDVTIGGVVGEVSIQVKCLGYVSMLDYYPDNTASGNGTINLNTKIETILAADPDSIFSTDYSKIATNVTQVSKYWEIDQTARALIKSLVALGSPSPGYERHTWGIYGDLQMTYRQIPTDYKYQHRLHHNRQSVIDTNGFEVYPWDVRPGEYMLVSDFLVGRNIPVSDLKTDPRMMFIETVAYTAPWGLSLRGGKTNTLNQKLERLNLGGL